jgi:recombination protein RecT
MSNEIVKPQTEIKNAKDLFAQSNVKSKFEELLGKRSTSFITSVLQIVASNDLLSKAEPNSIFHAAAVAATLDLPINNSLGFAYIVPYNTKQADGSYRPMAQFQLGYKGLKQLALRSGQFLTLHETDVREGEIKSHDRLTGEIVFQWVDDYSERAKRKVIGYVSYFKLLNGFSQTFYMPIQDIEAHARKYSQTFKKGYGLWKDDFDSMAMKTVVKLNLGKNAPLSIDLQKAVLVDQAIINNEDATDVTYIDNNERLPEPDIDVNDIISLYEFKKPLLSDEKIKNYDRIIRNKEANSYKKMWEELNATA